MNRTLTGVVFAMAFAGAQAVPVTYTNEANFLAAIGGAADVVEDFNSFLSDQSFRNTSFDVGPFTLSSSGSNQNAGTQNQVDTTPFSFGNFSNVNGTTHAHFFITTLSGGTTASIQFDSPLTAFGATFKELANDTNITFTTQSGAKTLTPGIGLGVGFFGFVLDPGETLTSLTFVRGGGGGDGFGMDDVLLATTAVPEPGVLGLVLLGLAGARVRRPVAAR